MRLTMSVEMDNEMKELVSFSGERCNPTGEIM
jgi:hypothetical protein